MSAAQAPSYKVRTGWEQLPEGFHHRDVCGVAVDPDDRVFVLTRGESRVIVYDRNGKFITSWAEGMFTERTHCIRIGDDSSVYCVDDGDHTVRKFSPDGELLLVIGTPGNASETGYDGSSVDSISRGGPPFNRPTGVALGPDGDMFVSDGYGNARVHRFNAGGELIRSWGEPGTGPGQFSLPHAVCRVDDRLLVADRENDRIQFFDFEGDYLDEWTHVQRPTDIYAGSDGLLYVSELPWRVGQTSMRHGPITSALHGKVCILDRDGTVLTRIGGPDGEAPGSFWAPHAVCVDSAGDLYVGEVCYSFSGLGKAGLLPPGLHTFQKLERQAG